MIAFFIFFALMIVCIAGGVWISMYLYRTNGARYLPEQQLVTLSQEAFIEHRPYKQRRVKVDMGMRDCARRVSTISMGVLAVMLLLIVMFLNAGH